MTDMTDSDNNDLFSSVDNEASPRPGSDRKAESAPAEMAVLTEDSIVEEAVIPDVDAGSARSCGEFLRIQREKLNLSYQDVFEKTRLKPEIIRALEEEDLDQLPAPVYVVAYVKRLCQLYNVNNALAREFSERLREKISFDVPENIQKAFKVTDISKENMRRIRNMVVVVLLVLALLLILTITGITMVILNLNRADHRLEKKTPFSEKTLIELQTKPKLQMTEL
jgi:cytoskeletal protein RodZ